MVRRVQVEIHTTEKDRLLGTLGAGSDDFKRDWRDPPLPGLARARSFTLTPKVLSPSMVGQEAEDPMWRARWDGQVEVRYGVKR